mmetsp:Transcript_21989/g.36840  ORF Transcript_21989/g.36840 Transcript_21989/m.36840 type:complete len:411 (+) Transcript_21989:145-1377(+)|eukprot:CAMPEP_0174986956 /NCGR_PEP_ID=MMETSP0004_2-20121128/19256_1 /TAXON_ID=420556 /ORGANISM="Ochromonas sp., Strain CCMP1393" /LENGTH=410 /DNA_ID=CAMNT_0016239915 /DNA_START=145 /DNA_END=1377 /DNA_ORIENTATION=+
MFSIFAASLITICCLGTVLGRDFDWNVGNTSVWLSSGAYCPTDTYLTRTYYGYSAGFVATHTISDEKSDTQGYIGYIPDQETIYVVLRGSTSVQNWIDDLDFILVPFQYQRFHPLPTTLKGEEQSPLPQPRQLRDKSKNKDNKMNDSDMKSDGNSKENDSNQSIQDNESEDGGDEMLPEDECADCFVHEGFYYAWNRVADAVIEKVSELRERFPSYQVVVTGHSLGGALASLCALSLQYEVRHGRLNRLAWDQLQEQNNDNNDNNHNNNKQKKNAKKQQSSSPADSASSSPPLVRLFNFGSPRFGDPNLAKHASAVLPDRNRVTHARDMAPHCPSYLQYTHISGEWYEPQSGLESEQEVALLECAGFEDEHCATQWYYTTIQDHMSYLGLAMGCKAVSQGLLRSTVAYLD